MKYSGIGGQAVMEGVMMKNGDHYAVAVRRPDHEIEIMEKEYRGIVKGELWKKIPMVRGVINFIDSLVLGMSTLMYSAKFFMEDEPEEEEQAADPGEKRETGQSRVRADEEPTEVSQSGQSAAKGRPAGADKEYTEGSQGSEAEKKGEKSRGSAPGEKALMGGIVAFAIVVAVAVFIILPYFLSQVFQRFIDNQTVITILEGALRVVIFVAYIVLISRMEDIQRVFMYHGAEHKCINCIEHGLELNVENVRASSKVHKRCGTSFLMFVVVLSVILFLFIRVDSHALRLVIRLLLVPVIAGISYELLRVAGRSDNPVINFISKPGLWMQGLTTKEPDDGMIEVGIASVEAVFDWKSFIAQFAPEETGEKAGSM